MIKDLYRTFMSMTHRFI